MFCPDCGIELDPRNKFLTFCCNCGFNVKNRNKEFINKDLELKDVFVINKKNKKCGKCGDIKPIEDFFERSNGNISCRCKKCNIDNSIIRKAVLKYRLAAAVQKKK